MNPRLRDPYWEQLLRRLSRPGQITLGPTEAVGYYASPELARQVDPLQVGLRLAQRQDNAPAMQRSQAAINAQGRSFPGALADVAANNLVDVVLPGDYSQFDEQAMERAGDPNAPLFPGRLQEMFKAHASDVGPTRADAYGLAAAGGAVGGNLGLNAAIPNAGNLTPGMSAREIGLALLRGGAVEGVTGGALAYGDAVGQGMAPGDAFRAALPQAGIQAGLGMAFRGLHGQQALRAGVAEVGQGVRGLLDEVRADFGTGPEPYMTPMHEYQWLEERGLPIPKHLQEFVDQHEARLDAEEGITRPQTQRPSLLPDLASERGAVGVTDTPEFRQFFGQSKVVDEAGKPMVLYHGTRGDFSDFTPSSGGELGRGIYLADDPLPAEGAAARQRGDGGESVMPVYVKMERPFHATEREQVRGLGPTKLQAMGYDGIIYEPPYGDRQYVVFNPEQIKSATGNRGTFDPTSANITLGLGALAAGSQLMPSDSLPSRVHSLLRP